MIHILLDRWDGNHNHRMMFCGGKRHPHRQRVTRYNSLKKRNGLFRRLQGKLFSSQSKLQTYATTQLNRIQTAKSCCNRHKGTLTITCAKNQGIHQFVFKVSSIHGKSPQNDKQKAQTKLSLHSVSATKTKRESVSLENQNGTEHC